MTGQWCLRDTCIFGMETLVRAVPTRLVTDKITPGDPDTTTSQGIYTPPRLVIP